jgi:hypothetical protein
MNLGNVTKILYKDAILIVFGEERGRPREERVGFLPIVNIESLFLVGDTVTFAMSNGGEITMELDRTIQPQMATFVAFRVEWERQFQSKCEDT